MLTLSKNDFTVCLTNANTSCLELDLISRPTRQCFIDFESSNLLVNYIIRNVSNLLTFGEITFSYYERENIQNSFLKITVFVYSQETPNVQHSIIENT